MTWCVLVEGAWAPWPGLSLKNARRAFSWALERWSAVCGITFREVGADDDPMITITAEPIGDRGGTGAYSEIPDGSGGPVTCRIDTGLCWAFAAWPPAGFLDLGRVLLHEVGHLIGIGHASEKGNLMYSRYQPDCRNLGPWDIAEARLRYGPPPEPPRKTA